MTTVALQPNRLVLADLVPGARVRDAGLVLAGAGLVGAAAQVSIVTPLSPVPFTLQTLAVLVAGASLGSVRGVLSMLTYLAAGLAGVPWFESHTSGWAGPSFGYILGFVVAAGLVGSLARRGADRHVVSTLALMAAGTVVVYAVGTTWLALDLHVGAVEALKLGVRPFLVTDAIKVGLAALAFPAAWKLARR
ncbi:biotin transporter BioY [Jatrophihabitans endophyticus]|uniref:biotin transporter BioY n=1 Tax=Jatrophihabitans endophyticus TaxID=1206085 RepID=UPI0019DF2DF6|nr:biotin transporter BioY [Jatrophihabitans endophyticus]MBE7188799.1 biotin transporter BioY [Jatrophihabitans endophyticus]